MKKLVIFLSLISNILYAQVDMTHRDGTVDIENVAAIYAENSVQAYVSTHQISYKKKYSKIFTILDLNADEKFNFEIENSSNVFLVESSIVDSNLAFLFVDFSQKKILFKIYQMNGSLTFDTSFSITNSEANYMSTRSVSNNTSSGKNKFLIGTDQGYIILSNANTQTSGQYNLHFFKLQTRQFSTYIYRRESPIYEVKYLGMSPSAFYFSFLLNGKYNRQFTTEIVSLYKKNFELNYEIIQPSTQEKQFFSEKVFSLENTDTIQLIGYYFTNNIDMTSQFYTGISYMEIEPLGDIRNEKYFSFQSDLFDEKYRMNFKMSDVSSQMIQHIVKTEKGDFQLITEGYEKFVDGLSTANTMMSSRYVQTYIRIKTNNLVILHFDKDFQYTYPLYVKKKKNSIQMTLDPELSIIDAGKSFNDLGFFDYLFTLTSNQTTNIFYRNFSLFQNGGKDYEIGKISIEKDKSNQSYIVKQPNTTNTYFLPNRADTILIAEWIRGKKKLYFDFKSE